MAVYSLADYTVAITKIISEARLDSIRIGGQGSMLETISIDRPTNVYETNGDSTGGYVHNKSYNKTGTVSLTLNQLSSNVSKFISLCNIYARPDVDIQEGLTMTLTDSQGEIVATCIDCMPQRIPEQSFGSTAATQTWTFTCGIIEFV